MPLVLPPGAISRAWLKMEEALRWARFAYPPKGALGRNRQCPGRIEPGALAAWLLRDRHRSGGDGPADPGPSAVYPYSPPRRGGAAARLPQGPLAGRRHERPARVHARCGAVHRHPCGGEHSRDAVDPEIPQWKLAEEVPAYLDRIRGWGYNVVRARQLQHNRREFCVAALQQPFRRKSAAAFWRDRR